MFSTPAGIAVSPALTGLRLAPRIALVMADEMEITVSRPAGTARDEEPTFPRYDGPAFLSYGFRPFFLGAALFAGLAVPAWVLVFAGVGEVEFLYRPREWHVHEMLFGFLPAVMAGFLLTAIPNWTEQAPLRGLPLLSLFLLWLAGRLFMAWPRPGASAAAVVDTAFLVILAAFVWWQIAAAGRWDRAPIGVLISLYAGANGWFHLLVLRGAATDLPERLALAVMLLLLTLIGGRITPTFTGEFLERQNNITLPASSRIDVLTILLVLAAAVTWIIRPESMAAGGLLILAGSASGIRLWRWRGWRTWREPLVLILHVGYAWVALSLLALGGAALGIGLPAGNAVHVLTGGAVGAMTLAVMTRASLGHTGRPRHADGFTVVIYALVNVGALLRVLTPNAEAPTALTHWMLGAAALGWSGAYLLFALVYGPIVIRRSLDEAE